MRILLFWLAIWLFFCFGAANLGANKAASEDSAAALPCPCLIHVFIIACGVIIFLRNRRTRRFIFMLIWCRSRHGASRCQWGRWWGYRAGITLALKTLRSRINRLQHLIIWRRAEHWFYLSRKYMAIMASYRYHSLKTEIDVLKQKLNTASDPYIP